MVGEVRMSGLFTILVVSDARKDELIKLDVTGADEERTVIVPQIELSPIGEIAVLFRALKQFMFK